MFSDRVEKFCEVKTLEYRSALVDGIVSQNRTETDYLLYIQEVLSHFLQ